MALTQRQRDILLTGLADQRKEVIDILALKPSSVSALGTTTDLTGVDGTGSNAAPLVGTEARLDAIEAKLDELINALNA